MSKILMIHLDKTYPAAITNYSLSIGQKLGFLKGSQVSNLVEDGVNMLQVIYLALIGQNKNFDLSYNEFLNFEWGEKGVYTIYNQLITSIFDIPENKFSKGIEKNISKKVDKGVKKVKPLTLNFECVEDRYVIYCLVYGISEDIFWYYPIADVERIFEGIKAYRAWQANPM